MNIGNVWYTPDFGFKLISPIQLSKKGVEIWLRTTDQASQILHDEEILGYADPIDRQYVPRVKKTSELFIIANSTSSPPKESNKPHDIKLWHSRKGHLGYRSLTIFKNLTSEMEFYGSTPGGLCKGRCKED